MSTILDVFTVVKKHPDIADAQCEAEEAYTCWRAIYPEYHILSKQDIPLYELYADEGLVGYLIRCTYERQQN